MSFARIWAHCVWATKEREKVLSNDNRRVLVAHIIENARNKNIYMDSIDGYTDHLHSLISLGSDQCISKVVQLIKGEASHWANLEGLFPFKLEW